MKLPCSSRSFRRTSIPVRIGQRHASHRASEPLRILYCGSDDFSAVSLRALHELHRKKPTVVQSIDVVCKKAKRVGRGLKRLARSKLHTMSVSQDHELTGSVPVKEVGEELALPTHEIDTFTGWEVGIKLSMLDVLHANKSIASTTRRRTSQSHHCSLVWPVCAATNPEHCQIWGHQHPPIHPTRVGAPVEWNLPNIQKTSLTSYCSFRGASPIPYTLLHGRTRTGVTLQTLHPERIDHGKILMQTPPPGIKIPKPDETNIAELTNFLAPKAAQLLVQGLRDEVYLSGPGNTVPAEEDDDPTRYPWAPKLSPDDRRVDWNGWTAAEILRRQRVLGPLWNMAQTRPGADEQFVVITRVILGRVREVSLSPQNHNAPAHDPTSSETLTELLKKDGHLVKVPGVPFLARVKANNGAGTNEVEEGGADETPDEANHFKVYVWTCDQKLLEIRDIKPEGGRWIPAARSARRQQLYDKKPGEPDPLTAESVIPFRGQLQ